MKKSDPVKTNPDKLSKLKKRKLLVGDPEDIVHMNWFSEWTELRNLGPGTEGARNILDKDICKKKP
jgi:hypothetical protein